MKMLEDLELEYIQGGWSLDTQYEILKYLRGTPRKFESPASRAIHEEMKNGSDLHRLRNVQP